MHTLIITAAIVVVSPSGLRRRGCFESSIGSRERRPAGCALRMRARTTTGPCPSLARTHPTREDERGLRGPLGRRITIGDPELAASAIAAPAWRTPYDPSHLGAGADPLGASLMRDGVFDVSKYPVAKKTTAKTA